MNTKHLHTPSVDLIPNGHDGYIVRLVDIDNTITDLAKFVPTGDGPHRVAMSIARREARAYRDGVAEGIFRASLMLQRVIGAGV